MPILIDGYNLIGRSGALGLSLADEDKEKRLLDILARWRDRKGVKEGVSVIFDGGSAPAARGKTGFSHRGIGVKYAVGSADDDIIRKVSGAGRPRGLTVVTSDQKVRRQALLHGANVSSCEEFLSRLAAVLAPGESEKPPAPGGEEVEEWLRIFSGREPQDG